MSVSSSIFLRGIPAAFLAKSGIRKLGMPAEASAGMQQFAATGPPFATALPADKFGTLAAVSAGLLSLYFSNPENTREDGIGLTEEGLGLSKHVFLLVIGLGLLTQREPHKGKKSRSAIALARAGALSVLITRGYPAKVFDSES